MQIGFYFYFKKITVYGKKNIPKKGGVILSPNHQNGVIDPFIVGVDYGGIITSLTRADVFGGIMHWIFTQMNMIPVYRIRDGYSNLKNNDLIFQKCNSILGKGNPVQVFSEGKQHENYYLIPISKGSSRMAISAQKKYPDQNMYILPIGINYSNRRNPLSFIHLVYGKPIFVKDYIKKNIPEVNQINNLRSILTKRMRECLWIPEKNKNYTKQYSLINTLKGNESFEEIKKMIQEIDYYKKPRTLKLYEIAIGGIGYILNAPVLIATKFCLSRFNDIVYYSTVKFYCALLLLPLWWVSILLLGRYVGFIYSVPILFISIISLYIRQNNQNIIFNK